MNISRFGNDLQIWKRFRFAPSFKSYGARDGFTSVRNGLKKKKKKSTQDGDNLGNITEVKTNVNNKNNNNKMDTN